MKSRIQGTSVLGMTGVIAILALTATGCIGDDTVGPTPVELEDVTFAPSLDVDLSTMTRTAEGLYYEDLVVGEGAMVEAGDSIAVHYSAWLADGTPLETTTNGPPAWARVGVGRLIEGWELGLPGVREGGTRKLVIRYQLAHGANAVGTIPPYANLVFDVQVVEIHGKDGTVE
jgi:FKBP-type peptidyl-prolyl cis-trans isomerase FkpA